MIGIPIPKLTKEEKIHDAWAACIFESDPVLNDTSNFLSRKGWWSCTPGYTDWTPFKHAVNDYDLAAKVRQHTIDIVGFAAYGAALEKVINAYTGLGIQHLIGQASNASPAEIVEACFNVIKEHETKEKPLKLKRKSST